MQAHGTFDWQRNGKPWVRTRIGEIEWEDYIIKSQHFELWDEFVWEKSRKTSDDIALAVEGRKLEWDNQKH